MDANQTIQVAINICVLIGFGFTMFKFIQNGRDADRKLLDEHREAQSKMISEAKSELGKEISNLHDRINGVKDEYATRIELERELGRLYTALEKDRRALEIMIDRYARDTKDTFSRIDTHIQAMQSSINDTITQHLALVVAEVVKSQKN